MLPLFDAHCHLAPSSGGMAAEAGDRGVAAGRLLCGVAVDDWERLASVSAAWPGTVPAFGLHPWHAGESLEATDWLDRLERLLTVHPAAWLGEAGLDGLKTEAASPAVQKRCLAEQLRLAKRLGRPVNLHCVKAWDDLLAALDAEYLGDAGDGTFIVHSFGGPHQMIRALARRGGYFTVGPLQARGDSPRRRARCALLPEERILLESDAFLQPGRDAYEDLTGTLDWLAAARGVGAEDLAATIADNCGRIFGHA